MEHSFSLCSLYVPMASMPRMAMRPDAWPPVWPPRVAPPCGPLAGPGRTKTLTGWPQPHSEFLLAGALLGAFVKNFLRHVARLVLHALDDAGVVAVPLVQPAPSQDHRRIDDEKQNGEEH